jgi:hypothetical protein
MTPFRALFSARRLSPAWWDARADITARGSGPSALLAVAASFVGLGVGEVGCAMRDDKREFTPVERALGFVPCAGCDWDFETGEGLAPCGRYFCPDLPDLLDVRCPTCLFNFATGASNSQCGEVHTCRFSHEQAPARVELFQRWLASGPRQTPVLTG